MEQVLGRGDVSAPLRGSDVESSAEAGNSGVAAVLFREARGISEQRRHCVHIKMEMAINYQNGTFFITFLLKF